MGKKFEGQKKEDEKVVGRFYKGGVKSSRSGQSTLVAAHLLSMHKRLAATNFDKRLTAMVSWKSPSYFESH